MNASMLTVIAREAAAGRLYPVCVRVKGRKREAVALGVYGKKVRVLLEGEELLPSN